MARWKVIEDAYGDSREITGFRTKASAVFYAQCTRCTQKRPRRTPLGMYELLGRDLIVKET